MIPRGCAIVRGGYGRPLTSTIFGLVFVCRVTGTLRTTLCWGGRLLPPQVLLHTHVFVPQVSLSRSCQTLTSNCPQNDLEECTEHKKSRQLLFCVEGGHAVLFSCNSVQEIYPILSSNFFFCRAIESRIPNRGFLALALCE